MTENTYLLTAENREASDSADSLRIAGFIPVELYGKNEENLHLKVKATDFAKIFAVAGESALIDLKIGDNDFGKILIKDVQINPLKDNIIHADLYKINMKEKITTEIPLVFEGVAPAVKEMGGVLVKQVDKVHVQCLPSDLVHEIKVDLNILDTFDKAVLIKDLVLPDGIEVLNDETVLVVSVAEPRKVEEAIVEAVAEDTESADSSETEEKKDSDSDSVDKSEEKKE